MEKWLSGRKRFFAKEVNLKRVPWVRIPPSPPFDSVKSTVIPQNSYSLVVATALCRRACAKLTKKTATERRGYNTIVILWDSGEIFSKNRK